MFIEKYVSCSFPENDEDLKQLVQDLQQLVHSQMCQHHGHCRFNFPKPPTERIIISDVPEENIEQELAFAKDITLAV